MPKLAPPDTPEQAAFRRLLLGQLDKINRGVGANLTIGRALRQWVEEHVAAMGEMERTLGRALHELKAVRAEVVRLREMVPGNRVR